MQSAVPYHQPEPRSAATLFEVAAGFAFCVWDYTVLLNSLQYNCRPGDDEIPNQHQPLVDAAFAALGTELPKEKERAKTALGHYLNWLERHHVGLRDFRLLTEMVEWEGMGLLQGLRRVGLSPTIKEILFQTHRIIHLPRPMRLAAFTLSRCEWDPVIAHKLSFHLHARGMFDSEFERFYYFATHSSFGEVARSQCERLAPMLSTWPEATGTLQEIIGCHRSNIEKLVGQLS